MVSEPSGSLLSEDGPSRAQLILLGSIAIAVVIIGLTVLINTVLFTESVGSSSLDNRIDETSEFDSEVITGTRSLVFRIGHGSRNMTEAELRAAVDRNMTRYGRAVAESYATSRPVAVSVSYSNDSEIGNRTVQGVDENITNVSSAGNAEDWRPVDDATVGWFTLNIDVRDTTTERLYINATNASAGEWVNVSINRTQGGNISVSSTVSGATGTNATCTPVDGRVLLDIYEGSSLTQSATDCSFNGTSTIEAPYTIDVVNGENLVGKYSIVTKEPTDRLPACSSGTFRPCVAPVLWTANISTAFEGESVTYDNTYNVSIYGEKS